MPPSCSAGWGSSGAGTAHPQSLVLPTCAQPNHWDFLPGTGNFTVSASAEGTITVFTHQTHEENWERGWSQDGTKHFYLSRSLGCATQSPTSSSSGLWVVWNFKFFLWGGCFLFCFFFLFFNIHFKALPSLLRWKAWAGKQLGNLQHAQALETLFLTKKANLEIKEKKKDFMWSTWTERAEVDFLFSFYQHFIACFYLILTEQ